MTDPQLIKRFTKNFLILKEESTQYEKKEFENFIHMNEFRIPLIGEWYQENSLIDLPPQKAFSVVSDIISCKRWILKRKEIDPKSVEKIIYPYHIHTDEFRFPKKGEFFQCAARDPFPADIDHEDVFWAEPRWILKKTDPSINPKRWFEGYVHTDEYRAPKDGEYYQSGDGSEVVFSQDCFPKNYKRWIMKKVTYWIYKETGEYRKPRIGEFFLNDYETVIQILRAGSDRLEKKRIIIREEK